MKANTSLRTSMFLEKMLRDITRVEDTNGRTAEIGRQTSYWMTYILSKRESPNCL